MGMRMNGWYDLYSLDKINDGEDTAGLQESLRCSLSASCRVLCSRAFSLCEDVRQSRFVESLIAGELAAGIPSTRILVGGFSQGVWHGGSLLHLRTEIADRSPAGPPMLPHAGGAMALLALRLQHRLAGVLALSSYLPMRSGPDPVISPANAGTPVLMLHGDADPTVRCHLCTPAL